MKVGGSFGAYVLWQCKFGITFTQIILLINITVELDVLVLLGVLVECTIKDYYPVENNT